MLARLSSNQPQHLPEADFQRYFHVVQRQHALQQLRELSGNRRGVEALRQLVHDSAPQQAVGLAVAHHDALVGGEGLAGVGAGQQRHDAGQVVEVEAPDFCVAVRPQLAVDGGEFGHELFVDQGEEGHEGGPRLLDCADQAVGLVNLQAVE